MNPGTMTHRITVQCDAGATQDTFGAQEPDWKDLDRVWAKIIWLGSKERFVLDRTVPIKAGTVVIYWRSDVSERNRLLIDGEAYSIIGIKELGSREGLELAVERAE